MYLVNLLTNPYNTKVFIKCAFGRLPNYLDILISFLQWGLARREKAEMIHCGTNLKSQSPSSKPHCSKRNGVQTKLAFYARRCPNEISSGRLKWPRVCLQSPCINRMSVCYLYYHCPRTMDPTGANPFTTHSLAYRIA